MSLTNGGIDASYFAELALYQELFLILSNKAVTELAKANGGAYAGQFARWFGVFDNTHPNGAVPKDVGKRMSTFRSVVNTVGITVSNKKLKERDMGVIGSASPPGNTWGVYNVSNATGKVAAFRVNSGVLSLAPINTDANTANWAQSCFANYVHELTHAFMNTEDVETPEGQSMYGPGPHLTWVAAGGAPMKSRYAATTHKPEDVASCWGFFFEDLMPKAQRDKVSNFVIANRKTHFPGSMPAEAAKLLK